MDTRRTFLTLAAIPLLLVPLGCAGPVEDELPTPDASADRDAAAPMQGRRVELWVPAAHASTEQIATLVEHIESQADVAQAKAAVRKSSASGDAELTVELWGHDMPADQQLAQAVQTEFPYVAQVDVSSLDEEPATPPLEGVDLPPDALRQQIIDDLRAKGVQGEIDVQITDHPDGRREVDVQVHDDQPPPA
ncbi:MAG: hypothetical protein AAGF11_27945 [Myxococcota bacterium]